MSTFEVNIGRGSDQEWAVVSLGGWFRSGNDTLLIELVHRLWNSSSDRLRFGQCGWVTDIGGNCRSNPSQAFWFHSEHVLILTRLQVSGDRSSWQWTHISVQFYQWCLQCCNIDWLNGRHPRPEVIHLVDVMVAVCQQSTVSPRNSRLERWSP